MVAKTKIQTAIDLFTGAGGLFESLVEAGFVPIALFEMDKDAYNTLKTRCFQHYSETLENKSKSQKKRIKKQERKSENSSPWNMDF